ncbi:MAG: sigma-70 family RNA polymerase sigma factor, partial [Pseudomonadota bacterium]|nr:sigma-70 family RNA polymerase sigma factor [Pseudomonadota bacterium]
EDVINMNRRMSGRDASLNTPLKTDTEAEWQDWLVDESDNQETILANHEEMNERRKVLSQAMGILNEREQIILAARRLSENPQTLEELSQKHSISRERVRQIEARAFEKIQKFIQAAKDDISIKA